MDDCLERLIDIIDTREDLKTMIPSERVATLIRLRLEMQAPYLPKWAQALSIQVSSSCIIFYCFVTGIEAFFCLFVCSW